MPSKRCSSLSLVLATYRRAAETVAASGLDHTILRPAWLSDEDEIDDKPGTDGDRAVIGLRGYGELFQPDAPGCVLVGSTVRRS
ncbi:NAD(P)H-binding protein [Streptomyces sp. SR-10]|uniref:NAD(P)H-binding protein n=1 Tax=Streptomyces sp. SR-10 TaxID=3416442 RepID=UPI003CF108AD